MEVKLNYKIFFPFFNFCFHNVTAYGVKYNFSFFFLKKVCKESEQILPLMLFRCFPWLQPSGTRTNPEFRPQLANWQQETATEENQRVLTPQERQTGLSNGRVSPEIYTKLLLSPDVCSEQRLSLLMTRETLACRQIHTKIYDTHHIKIPIEQIMLNSIDQANVFSKNNWEIHKGSRVHKKWDKIQVKK